MMYVFFSSKASESSTRVSIGKYAITVRAIHEDSRLPNAGIGYAGSAESAACVVCAAEGAIWLSQLARSDAAQCAAAGLSWRSGYQRCVLIALRTDSAPAPQGLSLEVRQAFPRESRALLEARLPHLHRLDLRGYRQCQAARRTGRKRPASLVGP